MVEVFPDPIGPQSAFTCAWLLWNGTTEGWTL